MHIYVTYAILRGGTLVNICQWLALLLLNTRVGLWQEFPQRGAADIQQYNIEVNTVCCPIVYYVPGFREEQVDTLWELEILQTNIWRKAQHYQILKMWVQGGIISTVLVF